MRSVSARWHSQYLKRSTRHSREDSEGVSVAQTSLPTLHGDNGLVGLDNVQGEGGLETEPKMRQNVMNKRTEKVAM
jgi:hypothetical protein